MTTSPLRHITRTRKAYTCDWCNTQIDAGKPCETYFCYGEAITVRMHLECFRAMQKVGFEADEELPPRGTYYRRGCWCGESPEQCECQ